MYIANTDGGSWGNHSEWLEHLQRLASASANASARYKIWGDKGNVSLRISDPFKLQKFGYKTANGTVLETSHRYFQSRAVFLTVSRNFGQALRLRPKSDPEIPQSGPPGG